MMHLDFSPQNDSSSFSFVGRSAVRSLCLFSAVLTLMACCSSDVIAQSPAGVGQVKIPNTAPAQTTPGTTPKTTPAARPVAKAMRVKLSPELEWILKTWESQGNQMTRIEGKFKRYVYDFTFLVQKQSVGEFYHVNPDQGRLDTRPVEVKKDAPAVAGPRGKKFKVQTDKPESWISDGEYITVINIKRREYQKFEIPKRGRGKNIVDGPLPFLFGISVEKAKARYRMVLHTDPKQGGMHNLKKNIVHLVVYPLWKQDAASWVRAEVLLDARTFLPSAIKLVHPGGTSETVYTFYDVKKNKKRGVFNVWKDPFKPNLSSFKELKHKTGVVPPKGTAKLPPRTRTQ